MGRPYINHTLCWDCARATGGCRWSSSLIPVKGWTAEKSDVGAGSYIVIDCPEFKRDSLEHGTLRIKKNRRIRPAKKVKP